MGGGRRAWSRNGAQDQGEVSREVVTCPGAMAVNERGAPLDCRAGGAASELERHRARADLHDILVDVLELLGLALQLLRRLGAHLLRLVDPLLHPVDRRERLVLRLARDLEDFGGGHFLDGAHAQVVAVGVAFRNLDVAVERLQPLVVILVFLRARAGTGSGWAAVAWGVVWRRAR